MILKGSQLASPELSTDVAIVGAGAAGITLAHKLQEHGCDTLLIEGGGLEVNADAQKLFQVQSLGETISPDEYRYRVFGGSTTVWSGRCAQLDPIDFEQREWVADSGWPITLADLADHYAEAAAVVGLDRTWQDEPESFARTRNLPHRPDSIDPFLWRFFAFGRKRFIDFGQSFHSGFRAADRLRVLLETDLVALDPVANGAAISAGRLRSRGGSELRVTARTWVLCCGGIENARLMLNFAEAAPAAFATVAPMIGRCFMQHPRTQTASIEASPQQADVLQRHFNLFRRTGRHYEAGFALSSEAQRREGLLNSSAVLRYSRAAEGRMAGFLLPIQRVPQRIARYAAGREPQLYGPNISLYVDVEQAPDRDSRVTLLRERDPIGLRKAAIDWRIGAADRQTSYHLTVAIARWIEALNLGRMHLAPGLAETGGLTDDLMLESYHHLGATRMSRSPADGVVDSDLKVHGLDNLYACGGSVMTTGGHANPTLTIVALADRLAGHLLRRNQAGR